MGEILVGQGAIDGDGRALLESLASHHLRRHGGDAGKAVASLRSGPSTRDRLTEIGDPDLDATVSRVASTDDAIGGDPTRSTGHSVGVATSDGRRFRVLRPHARGGLGVVSVALDAELNREVALKQMLDDQADDPASRRRFLVEAEVTGGLEHPGIVPVYGLGHDPEGRPYYAMRFIRGESLKQAIQRFHSGGEGADPGRRSLGLRTLLRRFVDVCNAIDYAHSRGILHRDIKPANVVVGLHGETLVVDWGLAKPIGRAGPESVTGSAERTLVPASAGGSSETLPGQAMGTPAYMSPEQAEGDLDRTGPRADVYSLGATLYCLATGRPPFGGKDLGAVLRDVRRGKYPAPRSLDPSLDPALEAVCLRAMATRPEDRYPTPRALADDVERWAAGEPVTAWREPMARRARRWAPRHRTASAAAVAATLVAVVGLAGVLAVQARAIRDLSAKNALLAEANHRVQARFDLAQEAIHVFQAGVSEDLLLKEEEFQGLRNKLLRGAAEFHGKLQHLLQGQPDRRSRAALGRAYDDLGELTAQIGVKTEALAVHRKALGVWRELADLPGAEPGARIDVARSLLAVGTLDHATGEIPAALAAFDEARTLAEGRASPAEGSDAAREVLATSLYKIGNLRASTGRPAEARQAYRRALEIREELARAHPDLARIRADLAGTHYAIGLLMAESGRTAEARQAYQRAVAIQGDRARTGDDRYALACYRSLIAGAAAQPGSGMTAEEAQAEGDRAMARLTGAVVPSIGNLALIRDDPDLDALRARPDFRAWIGDFSFPADPFAR
jgi:tetratricopeptide (TPR) repeat protein/tRNA A-37 threonylcarbamoyl transferase component Bud32